METTLSTKVLGEEVCSAPDDLTSLTLTLPSCPLAQFPPPLLSEQEDAQTQNDRAFAGGLAVTMISLARNSVGIVGTKSGRKATLAPAQQRAGFSAPLRKNAKVVERAELIMTGASAASRECSPGSIRGLDSWRMLGAATRGVSATAATIHTARI